MSEVDILIPCYKNIEEIRLLLNSLKEQENIKINKIVCPLTLSNEETDNAIKELFKDNNVIFSMTSLEKIPSAAQIMRSSRHDQWPLNTGQIQLR